MRLGVLTGGGDCPGLNAVIRAIVRTGARRDVTFVGFRDGWRGVLEDAVGVLDPVRARGILHRGGTMLGSSGVNPLGVSFSNGVEATVGASRMRNISWLESESLASSTGAILAGRVPVLRFDSN